jgi:hypothetical protein
MDLSALSLQGQQTAGTVPPPRQWGMGWGRDLPIPWVTERGIDTAVSMAWRAILAISMLRMHF